MKPRSACLVIVVLLAALVAAKAAPAHHSFTAEFDATKSITVTGVVTKVEWMNPHVWFWVDVKDPDGSVTNWGFQGGPPGQLDRRGVSKDTIQPGQTVTAEGFRAKDGTSHAWGTKVTFADGKTIQLSMYEGPARGVGAK